MRGTETTANDTGFPLMAKWQNGKTNIKIRETIDLHASIMQLCARVNVHVFYLIGIDYDAVEQIGEGIIIK